MNSQSQTLFCWVYNWQPRILSFWQPATKNDISLTTSNSESYGFDDRQVTEPLDANPNCLTPAQTTWRLETRPDFLQWNHLFFSLMWKRISLWRFNLRVYLLNLDERSLSILWIWDFELASLKLFFVSNLPSICFKKFSKGFIFECKSSSLRTALRYNCRIPDSYINFKKW